MPYILHALAAFLCLLSHAAVEGKKAHYDRANKEVAILCNHQRSVPKGHQGQMAKMQEKLQALRDELEVGGEGE